MVRVAPSVVWKSGKRSRAAHPASKESISWPLPPPRDRYDSLFSGDILLHEGAGRGVSVRSRLRSGRSRGGQVGRDGRGRDLLQMLENPAKMQIQSLLIPRIEGYDPEFFSNRKFFMMFVKYLTLSALAFAATATAASAATPTWFGTFVVTAVTPNCTADGNTNTVGEFGTLTYRPIINGGDAPEGMAFFFTRSTELIVSDAAGGFFQGTTNFHGIEIGRYVKPLTTTGSSTMAITPQTITANTKTITIKGHINNFFDNTPVCDVNFEAVLVPRI